ncbi:MAG TPA: HD domain-containing phosphohydrolase [Longimicrobiales bacterium]
MPSSDSDRLKGWLARARVLLVDDQPGNLKFLRHVLEVEGYGELIALSDPVEALERFEELDPDLVIADLWMAPLDGFHFIARVQELLPAGSYLPILVATGDHSPEARRRALSAGARDFLTKPLSPAEVRLRVRNLLETRFLHEQLREHNTTLEHRVAERTHELEDARLEILYRLARAAEFRDDHTGRHTLRVGRVAGRIAQVLGLPSESQELIARAAPLHDIGKIGIPDSILLKQDRLTPNERDVIQSHTVIGADILSGSRFALLQLAEEIALSHHERWDGAGYPHGLAREMIPLSGRIVAVADVLDALTHDRPYKPAWTMREALAEIEANAGTQFDPGVVEALLRIAPEMCVLESDDVDAAPPRAPQLASVPAPREPDPHTLATLRLLQHERDTLAGEVHELRQQLARTRRPFIRSRRSAQAN